MRARLLRPRSIAILVWLVALAAYASAVGLPTKRGNVLIWIALAVLALGIERIGATLRSFATTWLPLFAALGAYDLLRGASDGAASSAHTWPQLDLDLWLGGGRTPTEHLQGWLWDPLAIHWYDYLAWGTYQTHFLAPLLIAVLLWGFRHERAVPYILGIAALSWMALATYWLYPAQPPWMTARDGLSGEIDRVIRQVWRDVGVDRAARVFTTAKADGSKYSNPVAALPSLHAAFPMFIAAMLWGMRRWLNVVLAVYVLAMGVTLVYAGEHFTFDVLLGWLYALLVAGAARTLATRRRAHLAERARLRALDADPADQNSLTSRMLSPRPEPQASGEAIGTGSAPRDLSR